MPKMPFKGQQPVASHYHDVSLMCKEGVVTTNPYGYDTVDKVLQLIQTLASIKQAWGATWRPYLTSESIASQVKVIF